MSITPFEHRILQYVVMGFTAKEIADKLNKKVSTVRSMMNAMLKAAACRNMPELVYKAMKENIIN